MRVWFLLLMFKTKPVLRKLAKLHKTAQTAEIKAFTTEIIMLVLKKEKANVSIRGVNKQTHGGTRSVLRQPFKTQTAHNFILK